MVYPINNYSPVAQPWSPYGPMAPQSMWPQPGTMQPVQDTLSRTPMPTVAIPRAESGRLSSLWFSLRHPRIAANLTQALSQNLVAPETLEERKAMAQAVVKSLSRKGQQHFLSQLKAGRLTDTQSDNGRSTLSHLYAIVSTPRAQGINGSLVADEVLRLLDAPQTITQKFSALTPQAAQQLMAYYQQTGLAQKLSQPLTPQTLQNVFSATCVASSVMYYMVKGSPAEFSRHIAELTSPKLGFVEKTSAQDVSPEDPSQAPAKFANFEIEAHPAPGASGQNYWVNVNLPKTGMIRALNQVQNHQAGTRGIVESLYQDALTHLVEKSYEPGLSMRQDETGQMVMMDGLIEEQKTMLESIMRDNGGVMAITYQFTPVGQDNEAYLMGYFRDFDRTLSDITTAIDAGNTVLVGYVETDPQGHPGRLDVKHEVLIAGYGRNPQTGELMLTLADSDDDNPNLTQVSAREFIPKIHHAGFPAKQAFKIIQEIHSLGYNRYGTPTAQDAVRFKPIATVPRMQHQTFLSQYDQMMAQAEAQQMQQAPMGPQPGYGPQPGWAYA